MFIRGLHIKAQMTIVPSYQLFHISSFQYGDTPLHTASRYGHAGAARILLSAQANPNLQNKVRNIFVCLTGSLTRKLPKVKKIAQSGHTAHRVLRINRVKIALALARFSNP